MIFYRILKSRKAATLLLTMGLSSATLCAQTASPVTETPLTLATALQRAVHDNPTLASFSSALRVADAKRLQAGYRPNPRLGLQLENLGGTGEVSGTRALETTLMLSQLIELGGKRERRIALATTNVDDVHTDYAITRLDIFAEVGRRFIHVARDQELLTVAESAVALAAANVAAVEKRVAAARVPRAQLNRANIELARARILHEHQQHNLSGARRRLAATWASEAPDFERVAAVLNTQPATRPLEELLAELRTSPDLKRYLSARRIHQAEAELAKANAVPNLTIGAGLRRLEEFNDEAFMLSFSFELPVLDRNQGNIAAALAGIDHATSEEETHYMEAQAILFTTYQELQHARVETAILNDTIIPQSQEALHAFETGYQNGRFSYLELADARREFLELRAEAIRAAASYHLFLIEIERLTGIGLGLDGTL